MSTPDLAQQPMSDEDGYAAFVAAAEKPAEAAPAAEAQQTPQDDLPRDEHGRFAPRADAPQDAAPVEKEPFAGFSALPPEVQEQFRGMLKSQETLRRERDSFRNRFSRANNDLLQYQRSQQRPNTGPGRQTQPAAGTGHQAQPGIAQARADVAAMPAGAERDNASVKLDAWEAHAKQYPDDAAAISQYVQALRAEILGTVAPQLQELEAMRAELRQLSGVAEDFRSQQDRQRRVELQSTLDDIVPGWRVVAGWEDEQGNPVHEGRQWHPEFSAWLEGHDPEVRGFKMQQLGNGSPHVVAEVIRQFYADLDVVNGQQQQAPNPVDQRRAEALRDVAPGSAGGKPGAPVWQQGMSEEDQWAAFMAATGKR